MERQMIFTTIRMTISPQKRGEALKILRSMNEQSQENPGCLSSHLYGDLLEEGVIMIEELWRTERDLNKQMRSDEYRNLLLVIEMAVKQPEIRFNNVSSWTGIETIEKARSPAG
jgi:quinol monooxygenase YgiN